MAVLAAYLGSLVPALGWTLAHFLWQGALIALVLEVLLKTCRTAGARHNLALGALILMAAAPVATFAWLQGDVRLVFVPAGFPGLAASLAASQTLTWEKVAVAAWLTGVAVLAFRTAGGLLLVERLRQGAQPLPPAWAARCRLLQHRMAGSLSVAFAQSQAVATPLVAGWLKPMVLIPAAALARMPADQLEALILHELAHVRRLDAFANLIQAVVETALFYHPAVWWVSRRIRIEREHGCDDLAVAAIQDPALYVRALRSMEALRPAGTSVLAANGGDLKARAARILGLAQAPARPALSRIAAVLILTLTGAAVTHSAAVQAEPTQPAPAAVAKAQDATPGPMPPPPVGARRPARIVLAEAPAAPLQTTLWNDPAMAARIAALGPMPPDSQPAAQAAWRLKRYDLDLETDRRHAETDRRSIAAERDRVAALPLDNPNEWHRLKTLNSLDMDTARRNLTELHARALRTARDAVADAETTRRAAAAGKAKAADLAAAQARAAEAQRLADAVAEAIDDFAFHTNLSSTRLDQEIAKTTPGYPHPEISEEMTRLAALKERARLESLGYAAVRDAVEAGKLPAVDLGFAAQSLKAAQVALYDLRAQEHDRLVRLPWECTHGVAGADGKIQVVPEACPSWPDLPRPDFPVLPPRVAPLPALGAPTLTQAAAATPLDKMPPDSEPAAQAAWRQQRYEAKIERDRRDAQFAADMTTRQQGMLIRLSVTDPENPQRLAALGQLDVQQTRRLMSELDAKAAEAANDAFANAEGVRVAVAAGKASASDLAVARARAAEADRALTAADRAMTAKMALETEASFGFLQAQAATQPEAYRTPILVPDSARSQVVNQRVRLETLAYVAVRDAVDAGKRPAADLDAAARSLKAAQAAQYELINEMMRNTSAQSAEMQKRSQARLAEQEAQVADLEARVRTASDAARPALERNLKLLRSMLETQRIMAERPLLPERAPLSPDLPILPPRSWADAPAN